MFTQELADELKQKPLEVQVRTLLEIIDNYAPKNEVESQNEKKILFQFEDILRDIKVANKSVGRDGDFYQLRVDYVLKMRNEK